MIDDAAGNIFWQDAVKKEMSALIFHKLLDYKFHNFKPFKNTGFVDYT